MGSLFQELKRRKVFRVAAVYAVVAWLLIEVTSTVLPTFDTPAWVNQTITLLLILGFPITLVMAWAYDITPQGIKTDAGTQPYTAPVQSTDRNLIYLILALVVMVAGFQIADRFLSDRSSQSLAGNRASSSSNPNTQVVRSILPLGDLLPIQTFGIRTSLSLSADGSRIAYTSSNRGSHQIHIRDLDQFEPRPLGPPRTSSGAALPVQLSPDGEWVFFRNDNKLWKVSVVGGPTQLVTEGLAPSAFDWGTDGTIYFSDLDYRLRQVPASGGESQLLDIPFMPDLNQQFSPHILPEDKALLFTRLNNRGSYRIELFDLETQDSRVLIEAAYKPKYVATGHITFMREHALWAVPFDLDSLAISGTEVLLIEGIEAIPRGAAATYSLSDAGNLIYVPNTQLETAEFRKSVLAWVDRSGVETVLDMVPQQFSGAVLSPDGNRVALQIEEDRYSLRSDLWNYDLDRGTLSRVTFSGAVLSFLWSVDGERLIYGTPQGVRSINSNGLGQITELSNPGTLANSLHPEGISPDGQQLILTSVAGTYDQQGDLYTISMMPEHQLEPLINSEFEEHTSAISPDGRWLAYQSNETGRYELYVRPYPEIEDGKWQITVDGGGFPRWSPSSEELFFRHGTAEGIQTLMVTIETEPEFKASSPQILFTSDHLAGRPSYSVSADGQRLLMLKPVANETQDQVAIPTNAMLVENFDEELKRLVPAD